MLNGGAFAAVVAFSALGANFLAAALLLLFNPRSRAVRWYAIFIVSQLVWLLLQGLLVLGAIPPEWRGLYALDVHMMPALFFSATLVQLYGERIGWFVLVPLIVAAALLLVMPDPLDSTLAIPWHAAGWGVPALLHARHRREKPRSRSARTLNLILSTIVPVGVVGAIALQGGFVLYMLPLMTVAIQLLIFTGVVYHSFYDIEVRAARTGELAARAVEHDRLMLLGELAATIAHEIRNPLTGIRSLTQRIGEESLDAERRERYTSVIIGEIGRLDRIVGNLTDLARRNTRDEASGDEVTPLAPLFDDLQLLVDSLARRASVSIHTNAGELAVHASREALAQALLNLLLNALAHTPPRTVVELSAVRAPGGVSVRVRDCGPGIPEGQRERVFDPFHTTSGGTGLGLAVVRRLAREHGWTVEIADADGAGAEFRLLIPEWPRT